MTAPSPLDSWLAAATRAGRVHDVFRWSESVVALQADFWDGPTFVAPAPSFLVVGHAIQGEGAARATRIRPREIHASGYDVEWGGSRVSGRWTAQFLAIDKHFLAQAIDIHSAGLMADIRIAELADERLLACLDALAPASAMVRDPIYADHVAFAICRRLAALYGAPREEQGRYPLDRAKVEAFIESKLTEPVSTIAMAAALDVPIRALFLYFESVFGTSPSRYLRSRRLARARAVLEASDMSIADIATLYCFYDQAKFTHAFREVYKTTPARYRRERRPNGYRAAHDESVPSRISQPR